MPNSLIMIKKMDLLQMNTWSRFFRTAILKKQKGTVTSVLSLLINLVNSLKATSAKKPFFVIKYPLMCN